MNQEQFIFKKSLGQNFLKNRALVERIASCVPLTKNDLVIEVGPGLGIMSSLLCDIAGSVLAYEIDERLEDPLLYLASKKGNLKVIFNDFLNCNVLEDIENYEYDKLYFISNLPYYITTPIITKIIEDQVPVTAMVIMVQKEVGDRFVAQPGSKEYGSLTVFLNYYFDIKKQFLVKKTEFKPMPKVDSEVVLLKKKDNLLSVINFQHFQKLVKDSFQFKRKTIRNNLKNYDLTIVEKILLQNKFSLMSRAEEIPVEVFVNISNALQS